MEERGPYRRSDARRTPEPDQGGSSAAWIAGAAVVVAGVFGLLVGLAFGGGDPEVRTQFVTDTVTIASTETVTRTQVRTVQLDTTDPLDTTADLTDERSGERCSEDYVGACVPAGARSFSCSDTPERDITVLDQDPYGLDPDDDGIACES